MFTVEEFLMIRDLHHQGLNISQISRETGYHRNTVRKYLAAQTVPIPASRRTRPSKLDPYKAYIQQRIRDYPLSAARIYREIQEMGFNGKYTIVRTTSGRSGHPRVRRSSGMRPNPVSRRRWTGVSADIWMSMDGGGNYCFSMISAIRECGMRSSPSPQIPPPSSTATSMPSNTSAGIPRRSCMTTSKR